MIYILSSIALLAISVLPAFAGRGKERGLEIVRESEELRLEARKNPEGKWTIGYGHTEDVYAGMEITEEEAERFLKHDWRKAEKIVERVVKAPLTESQKAALTSFTLNLGESNLRWLVDRPNRLNSGNYDSVRQWLPRYVYLNKKKLKKLESRRKKELNLWRYGK